MSDTTPRTAAVEAAEALGLAHEVRVIERARSVEEAADRLGVPVEHLYKTLVVRRGQDDHLLVLVPGPSQLDWAKLRAHLGVSRLSLPDADEAREATGYERGTITPLGTRQPLPVIVDAAATGAERIAIGGGAHGVSLLLSPTELVAAVAAEVVDVTRN
ncbi:aminoacyl-tRNA deacylase [Egicoccus sp. AB-alg6-2]|uniref:aminoacyl-tRNA deacylase n=1 Tax=Egicoccus sp. AB-alg6-2 TaxID=3242692 RepID=UPI00359D2212